MPWKFLLRFTCAVLLAGWLGGCAASASPADDPSALVVGVPAGDAAAAEAAALEYTRAAGEPVRVEAIPQTAYERRVGEVLVAGLSDYDLLYLPASALAKYAGYHALRPWDDLLARDDAALERWLPLLMVDGALYGLPASADPLRLWYRADLLAGQGARSPAQDWNAFRAYALAANAPPERYGYLPAPSAAAAGLDLAAFLHGYGARVLEEAGAGKYRVALDTPQALAALDAFAALRHADGVTPALVAASPLSDPARAEGEGRKPVLDGLRKGEAALAFAPRSDGVTLLDCSAKSPACADGRALLEPAEIPSREAGSASCRLLAGLNAWVVPQRAARAGAAARFAAWLMSPEGAEASASAVTADGEPLSVIPAVLEEGACFATAFPPAAQPALFWDALGRLAVDLMQGEDPTAARARAEEALRAALRRQGMLSE